MGRSSPGPAVLDSAAMSTLAIIGSPTALGGHFSGMERGPAALRAAGLVDRLHAVPALAAATIVDHGDVPNDPGWAPDPDPRAKNRGLIAAYLPRVRDRVAAALAGAPDARLLILGGDCTSHSATMAGLAKARPGARFGIAWFDAHGDLNTPDTTPSGNVWGMPFAMLLGWGEPDLVGACDGPTAREEDAALLGGQVLDEQESRMQAASKVALFGAGMLATEAGMAALAGWARVVGERCDGLYIAFDLDALDETEGLSVAMPEAGGLSLETAARAMATLSAHADVVGFGPTATMPRPELDLRVNVEAIARLSQAAFG
jgi:arginase